MREEFKDQVLIPFVVGGILFFFFLLGLIVGLSK